MRTAPAIKVGITVRVPDDSTMTCSVPSLPELGPDSPAIKVLHIRDSLYASNVTLYFTQQAWDELRATVCAASVPEEIDASEPTPDEPTTTYLADDDWNDEPTEAGFADDWRNGEVYHEPVHYYTGE